jgi:signal transduction histidine kinase
MLIAYFMIRSLEVFRIEMRRRLEDANRSRALAQERERISRDLHDGILQNLYGAGLNLENALAGLRDEVSSTALIKKTVHSLNVAMQEIRNYIFALNWDEDTDLETKLKDLLAGKTEGDKLGVRLEIVGSINQKLPPGTGLHLYHFVQEAVSNARKHSHGTDLLVALVYRDDFLNLTIKDDGVGFVSDQLWQNSSAWNQGLKNMKRRAEMLGGKFAIKTGVGKGTEVSLVLPLRAAA